MHPRGGAREIGAAVPGAAQFGVGLALSARRMLRGAETEADGPPSREQLGGYPTLAR